MHSQDSRLPRQERRHHPYQANTPNHAESRLQHWPTHLHLNLDNLSSPY